MKIILLITVVESAALMLWWVYSAHKRRQSKLRTALRDRSGPARDNPKLAPLLPVPGSDRWSFVNEWQPQAQHDDRRPMSGLAVALGEAPASVRRAYARQSHQLMYKQWSQNRHE